MQAPLGAAWTPTPEPNPVRCPRRTCLVGDGPCHSLQPREDLLAPALRNRLLPPDVLNQLKCLRIPAPCGVSARRDGTQRCTGAWAHFSYAASAPITIFSLLFSPVTRRKFRRCANSGSSAAGSPPPEAVIVDATSCRIPTSFASHSQGSRARASRSVANAASCKTRRTCRQRLSTSMK
jgi:hypothetical protein